MRRRHERRQDPCGRPSVIIECRGDPPRPTRASRGPRRPTCPHVMFVRRKIFRAKRAHGGRSRFGRTLKARTTKGRVRPVRKTKTRKARSSTAKSHPRGRKRVRGGAYPGLAPRAGRQKGVLYRAASAAKGRRILPTQPSKSLGWWDQYIVTDGSNCYNIDPYASMYSFHTAFGWGLDIGTMLGNIRTESPFTLVGGAYVLQPTLYVNGQTFVDIYPASNASVRFEVGLFTGWKTTTTTLASKSFSRMESQYQDPCRSCFRLDRCVDERL